MYEDGDEADAPTEGRLTHDNLLRLPWMAAERRLLEPHGPRLLEPGAPTALAKVTGMIVTARVRLRVTAGCEAPLIRPAQRKFFRCLGVKRPVS